PANWDGGREGPGRRLGAGTIALQAHDPGSTVYYKNIRIKPLDAAQSQGAATAQAAAPAPGQGRGNQPTQPMTFFVTSVGLGKGANLGGLAGADAHCQALATAVGAGGRQWRAYLSTQGPHAINARHRTGKEPWHK